MGDLSNANFPMDAEGRVYHLGVKAGEGMTSPHPHLHLHLLPVWCLAVNCCSPHLCGVCHVVCAMCVLCVCAMCACLVVTAVANRILSVGDSGRAALLATFFDDPSKTFTRASTRGFVIHTGRRKGVNNNIFNNVSYYYIICQFLIVCVCVRVRWSLCCCRFR